MEKREAKRGSPTGQLPHQKNENHEGKTLGRKRPRRSTSSSPKNHNEIEIIDDTTIDVNRDSKMVPSSSLDATATTTTTNLQDMELGRKEPLSAAANSHNRVDKEVTVSPSTVAAVGVSLPWFERGGPLYKRPPSLLWDAPKDADRSRKGERKRKRTSDQGRGKVVPKGHFCGLPIAPKRLGVCAECGIDEQDTENYGNVVVLCDGPGCDREFHLKCCKPPLQQVPEGDFYCFDCHPKGGYAVTLLEDYLDEIEGNRDAHNDELLEETLAVASSCQETDGGDKENPANGRAASPATPNRRARRLSQGNKNVSSPSSNSENNYNYNHNVTSSSSAKRKRKSVSDNFSFVDKLIFEDMEENQPEFLSQLMNGICAEAEGKGPPRSELDFCHRHKEILVGCAVRLYCPKTNHYQTGRILNIRKPPSNNNDPNNVISEDYNRKHDTECLVRFPAGRDYRKKSVTRWIRLEEHSLAVACPHLVWGKFSGTELESSPRNNSKKAKDRWVPTKLWMRSSRELVMSMQLLDESMGQITYRDFRKHAPSSSTATTKPLISAGDATNLSTALNSPVQRLSPKRPERKNGYQKDFCELVDREIHKDDPEFEGTSSTNAKANISESKSYLQQEWILAECIGREIYKLVHVSTETKHYCFEDYLTSPKTQKNGGSIKKSTKKTSTACSTQNLSTKSRENEIMFALVQAEKEERNRILLWNKLPLQNAWHEKALTSLDEYSLSPLSYDGSYNQMNRYGTSDDAGKMHGEDENGDEEKSCSQNFISIEPTPLVRTGLDRMYILEQFVTHINKTQETNGLTLDDRLRGTKDLAMSLSSELVSNHSITACIQQQNRMARLRHSELSTRRSDSLPESVADANDAHSTVTCVGERANFVPEVSCEKTIKVDENTHFDIARTQPKAADSNGPKEEHRNLVVTQKPSRIPQSPTSSIGVPLLVLNEIARKGDGGGNIESPAYLDEIDGVVEVIDKKKVLNGDSISRATTNSVKKENGKHSRAKTKRTKPSKIVPGSSLISDRRPQEDEDELHQRTEKERDEVHASKAKRTKPAPKIVPGASWRQINCRKQKNGDNFPTA